jgi:hypothetical protein
VLSVLWPKWHPSLVPAATLFCPCLPFIHPTTTHTRILHPHHQIISTLCDITCCCCFAPSLPSPSLPPLSLQVRSLAAAAANTKRHGAPYRHMLFYGKWADDACCMNQMTFQPAGMLGSGCSHAHSRCQQVLLCGLAMLPGLLVDEPPPLPLRISSLMISQ